MLSDLLLPGLQLALGFEPEHHVLSLPPVTDPLDEQLEGQRWSAAGLVWLAALRGDQRAAAGELEGGLDRAVLVVHQLPAVQLHALLLLAPLPGEREVFLIITTTTKTIIIIPYYCTTTE